MEDLYRVLGVARDADNETIRKTFKKLARELHPDRNPDPAAAERFKRVTAANEVLSDPQRRALYDEFGEDSLRAGFDANAARAFKARGGGGFGGFEGGNPFQGGFGGFEDILGGIFGGGARGGARRARAGADLQTRVSVGLADAARGTQVPVRIRRSVACRACSGSGGEGRRTCTQCGGAGRRAGRQMGVATQARCEMCSGTGSVVAEPCRTCGGRKTQTEETTLQARIPAGVDQGQQLRLRGQGEAGQDGGPAGDVIVQVDILPHPLLRRVDRDLELEVPITLAEALGGAQLEVPVLTGSGKIRVRIPPNTQNGTRLRIPGRGVQVAPPGDLYLVLRPQLPSLHDEGDIERAATLARDLDALNGERDVRAALVL